MAGGTLNGDPILPFQQLSSKTMKAIAQDTYTVRIIAEKIASIIYSIFIPLQPLYFLRGSSMPKLG